MTDDEERTRLLGLVNQWPVPGAVLATSRGGDRPKTAAVGVEDRDSCVPLADDTIFPVGSISKLITATIVMQLVDEGRLDLDDDVREYVPELAARGADQNEMVTVRQLLTHTSGRDGDPSLPRERGETALHDFAMQCGDATRIAPPGQVVSYWNPGYVLLGRVAEVLDGKPWRDVLDNRIRRPLRLSNTVFDESDIRARRRSRGHLVDPLDGTVTATPFWTVPQHLAPTGGLWMSAPDLLAVGRLLLDGRAANGSRLLSESALTAMRHPHVEYFDKRVADALGLGLAMISPDHRLVGFFGVFLGHRAYLHLVPDRDYIMVLLANSPFGEDVQLAVTERLVGERFGVHLYEGTQLRSSLSSVHNSEDYVGIYRRSQVDVIVSEAPGGLEVSTRPAVKRAGVPPRWDHMPLAPVDSAHFKITLPPPAKGASFFFLDAWGRRYGGGGRPTYLQYWGRTHRRDGEAPSR
jgi:CubicO group peptidase (beta-lactamase class C family)